MGNNLASVVMKFDANRESNNLTLYLPNDVKGEYNNGTITWTLGPSYGPFNNLKFALNQVPASMGGKAFFRILTTDPNARTVSTAFVDQNYNVIRSENLGPYATGSRNDYEVQGNMTISSGASSTIQSIDPFRYVIPSVRTFSSANTTIDSPGRLLYNGQIAEIEQIKQVDYITLNDLNNSNSQYMLNLNITNNGNNVIGLTYDATQCPNIVSVVYENDNITMRLNADSPNISMIVNVTDASLGIVVTPDLILTRVDPRTFILSMRNGSIRTLMSQGTKLGLSLLLLPLSSL